MDLHEEKEKINRHGCDDYLEMSTIRPADHYQEIKMNSDDKQHQEEEGKINRPDQNHHKKILPAVDDDEDEEMQDEADKAAAPSEIQTLRIKIKLPKDELQQCACSTCGKVFSSRKAWGGHWKMHLKEEKEKENLKQIRNTQLMLKELQDSISNGGGRGGGGCRFINAADTICSICHKYFRSWKSLFGHMRTHPNRGWRGIRPPVLIQSGTAASATPSQSAATATSDVVGYVDLSRNLVGWAQTGKRGRPSTYCAASSLMNLAYSNPTLRTINNGARIQESASKRNKITISDSKAYFKSRDLKIVGRDESRTVQEFKCSSCSRSFASFQALGGHRSFHSKGKTSDTNVVEFSTDVVDSEAEEEDDNIANDSEETEEAHQCDVCDKSFSSGQALGGHKRCHWKGQTDQVASSSGEENQVVSNLVANEPGRKMVDFDLNELPDMDDN